MGHTIRIGGVVCAIVAVGERESCECRVAKEHGERSCVDQLLNSEGFMKITREQYAELVEKARKGLSSGFE